MITTIIIIWILLGIIACWRDFHGFAREYYINFGGKLWTDKLFKPMINGMILFYIVYIILGPISLWASENHDIYYKPCWWYKQKL